MKKRKTLPFVLFLVLTLLPVLSGCSGSSPGSAGTDGLKSITLNEVAHSIFYAPMYVAIEEGYFADEGLDVTLVTGFGADKVATAVVSGDADIGFMGSESSIYIYHQNPDDYLINFAPFLPGKQTSVSWEVSPRSIPMQVGHPIMC